MRSLGEVQAFVALLSAVVYLNSLRNGFVFDDNLAVMENVDAHYTSPLKGVFVDDFWGRDLRDESSHKSYRPLTTITYRLNSIFTGGKPECNVRICPGSWGYHLVNALLHAAATALVARLTGACTGQERHALERALIAGAVFALHPVHVEAVVNVVGRAELLACVLMACAFLAHAHAAAVGAKGLPLGIQLRCVSRTCVLFTLALFSKETALFVVLVCGAHEVLVILQASRSPLRSRQPAAPPSSEQHPCAPAEARARAPLIQPFDRRRLLRTLRGGAWRLAPLAVLCVAYLLLRVALMSPFEPYDLKYGAPPPPPPPPWAFWPAHWTWSATKPSPRLVRKAENPLTSLRGRPGPAWALSVLRVQVYHLWLLLWPRELSIEYSFECIRLVRSMADARAWGDLAVACAIVGWACARLWRAVRDGSPTACRDVRCLAWAVLPWVPASNILFNIGTFVAERLLYIPSVGFCMLLAQLWAPSVRPRPLGGRAGAALALGVLCAAAASRTMVRNLDWLNNDSAFISAVRVCPDSAKLQLQMGTLYKNRGDWEGAWRQYELARRIDPEFCDLDWHMAQVHIQRGSVRDAIGHLNSSLTCPFTVNSAAPALLGLFKELLEKYPRDAWLQSMVAAMYTVSGDTHLAVRHLTEAAIRADEASNHTGTREYSEQALALEPGACAPAFLRARALMAQAQQAELRATGGVEAKVVDGVLTTERGARLQLDASAASHAAELFADAALALRAVVDANCAADGDHGSHQRRTALEHLPHAEERAAALAGRRGAAAAAFALSSEVP